MKAELETKKKRYFIAYLQQYGLLQKQITSLWNNKKKKKK